MNRFFAFLLALCLMMGSVALAEGKLKVTDKTLIVYDGDDSGYFQNLKVYKLEEEPQPTEPEETEPQVTEPLPTEPQATDPRPTTPADTTPADNNNWIWVAAAAAAVVIVAIVVVVIKKKK